MSTEPGIGKIKNIIAIASGKGGVGKSTVAVNLAVALKESGASVGLLDADIYGPSQPGMLGSKKDKPGVGDNYLEPVKKHGISFVSMGLLTDEDSPVIWRAPIAMKMIHQFLGNVVWGELDYLLIDLPPGTGDVQLTLAQQAQLSGAVIVTTPQEVALGIAKRGLRMFEQVKVPIVGVIENMSGFTCKKCGEETEIFSKGGGKKMAETIGVPFLGSLPLDPELMMSGETGEPILTKSKDSALAKLMLSISENLKSNIQKVNDDMGVKPTSYEIDDKGLFRVQWSDERVDVIEPYSLRVSCPCAACVDEDSGRRILDPKSVSLDIKISGVNPVGNYGLAFGYSDGHNTGIYEFETIRKIADESKSADKQSFSV